MPILLSVPEPGLALVTIDNPSRRNALGPLEFGQLIDCWRQLERDPRIRCVIVTGSGTQAFCSGAQLDADFSVVPELDSMIEQALLKTRALPMPMIAAVNGHCVAGGFELMLACDLRVASSTAKLGLPEVRWGIVPTGGAAMKLVDQIGHARALQLLLTAELISAQQALEFGVVNAVQVPEAVMSEALRLARLIMGNSPRAVAQTKRLALLRSLAGWSTQEHEERAGTARVRASADSAIGRHAFLERVVPQYPDRDA